MRSLPLRLVAGRPVWTIVAGGGAVVRIEAELRAEFDRWERHETAVLRVLPFVLLGVCTVIALLLPLWEASPHLAVTLGLSVASAIWLLLSRTLHPGLYYPVLVGLAAGLVATAPWYGLFAFVGYPQAFHYLRGRGRGGTRARQPRP